jgi:rhamnogalacturonyl hydrolase YesR
LGSVRLRTPQKSLPDKNLNKLVRADVKQYFEEFTKNKDALSEEGGYEKKMLAAMMACRFLVTQTRSTDPELSKQYASLATKYATEQKQISKGSRW